MLQEHLVKLDLVVLLVRHFLFLVLKKKCQGEEQQDPDQNQPYHDLVVPFLSESWCGGARCVLRARARTSSDVGPVAFN